MRLHKEFFANPMIVFLMCVIVLNGSFAMFTYQGFSTWLSIVSGIALFGIFEYFTHRYLLHEWPKLAAKMYEGHKAHHDDPTNSNHLFSSVKIDVVGYLAVYLVVMAVTRSFHIMCAVMAGVSMFQLYYQWMHYIAHRPIKPFTPWGKWMKKKHLLHHYQDERSWYGVSNPVFDVLAGTDKTHKHY